MPHIHKNAGCTINAILTKTCWGKKEFTVNDYYLDHDTIDDYRLERKQLSENHINIEPKIKIENKITDQILLTDHNVPYTDDMKDWIKILVIRNPMDRIISWYNYAIWHAYNSGNNYKFSISEYIDMAIKGKPSWLYKPNSHIGVLNKLIGGQLTDQSFFDYIIDVTDVNELFFILKRLFFKDYAIIQETENENTANNNIKSLNDSSIQQLTQDKLSHQDIKKIHSYDIFNEDTTFYNNFIKYYTDDSQYVGILENNLRNKYGVYRGSNGNTYYGEWKNDLRHGYGKFLYKDGCTYEGQMIDDYAEGYGEYTWPYGRQYKGQWKNWKQHGKGTMTWKNSFSNELPDTKYEGNFENDKFNGYGIFYPPEDLYRSNKKIYKGNWKDDIFLEGHWPPVDHQHYSNYKGDWV